MADSIWLQRAVRIAERIGESAHWRGEACSWEVREPDRARPEARLGTFRPADATIYQGTAGIAWLFAELAPRTGELSHRSLALGALGDALARTEILSPTAFGFHAGRIGVAFVAARLGLALDESAALTAGRRLLEPMVGRASEDQGLDVIGGAAGAIPALLGLIPAYGESALELAVELGDHLIASARREPAGWCWLRPGGGEVGGLAGLAHGAAGHGLALLELSTATGEGRFRFAAEMAFLYERRRYDARAGNWPDLRHQTIAELLETGRLDELRRLAREGSLPPHRTSFMSAWCHGAPGIGLSRLRAYELTGQETYRREAERALQTTRRSLRGAERLTNDSLCHGRLGNADLLLLAADLLNLPAERALAAEVAAEAWDAAETQGLGWPCGTIDGVADPSLMLGEAGIAFFLLRLADPSVPSPLLLRPAHGTSAEAVRPASVDSGDGFDRLAREAALESFATASAAWSLLGNDSLAGLRWRPGIEPLDEAPAERVAREIEAGLAQAREPAAERSQDRSARPQVDPSARLADAARVDLALHEARLGIGDLTADLVDELRRPERAAIDWERGQFELPPPGRVVRTVEDWPALVRESPAGRGGSLEAFASGRPSFTLLARRGGRIEALPIGPFAGLILEGLDEPRRLGELRMIVARSLSSDPTTGESALTDKIRAQLDQLLAAGLVRVAPPPRVSSEAPGGSIADESSSSRDVG